MYNLEDATLAKPTENSYKVTSTIEGKPVQMDIHTGASLSLISEQTYLESTLDKYPISKIEDLFSQL